MGNNYTTGMFDHYFYGLKLPPNILVVWIGSQIHVSWDEVYTPDVQVEIWDSINGARPVQLGITALGASSFDIAADPNVNHSISIRMKKDEVFSGFSNPINLAAAEFYYVDPLLGNDGAGHSGSITDPFQTISYAATRAVLAGDIIHLVAGTFTEAAQIVLATGVSIVGVGVTSIITSAAALDPLILLSSPEGTNGNQSISNLQIDGNLTVETLIEVYGRSNVHIHDCTFVDANYQGIRFHGRNDNLYQFAGIRANGNSFYNNIVTNCAQWDAAHAWDKARGNVCFGGQNNFTLYNCTITQPDRGGAANGNGIKFCNWGEHYNTKIYNNTVEVPVKKAETGAGGGYAFAFELWSQRGGIDIYDNIIQGAIDLGGYDTNDAGGYGYAAKIYDNEFSLPALNAFNHNAIVLEQGLHGGLYIYRNRVTNYSRPVTFATSGTALLQGQEDVYFYYNIFENVRLSAAGWFGYCFDINMAVATTIHNLQILNNVVTSDVNTMYAFISSNDAWTAFENITVRNNAVSNAHACVEILNTTIDVIRVDNNDFFNTTHGTDYTGSVVTGNTYNNNIVGDPLFVGAGDFHLQAGSPCINAGINVGLTQDFGLVSVSDPPEIGAYEYV